jgi:hypothetical protein
MFAWQINLCLLIITLIWTEQLHLCAKSYSPANVSLFQSLFSKYGNYSESELWELKKDLWVNRSDEYKLEWSKDRKKWWDDQSDEYKQEWSEDKQKWWDDQSEEYRLKWSEDRKKWWDDQSDKYRLKWSEGRKKWWDDQSDEYKLKK